MTTNITALTVIPEATKLLEQIGGYEEEHLTTAQIVAQSKKEFNKAISSISSELSEEERTAKIAEISIKIQNELSAKLTALEEREANKRAMKLAEKQAKEEEKRKEKQELASKKATEKFAKEVAEAQAKKEESERKAAEKLAQEFLQAQERNAKNLVIYSELEEDVEQLQKKYALINRTGTAYVCNDDELLGLNFTNIKSFHEMNAHFNHTIGMKKVYATQEFMESKKTKRYDGIVFDPSAKASANYWNLWSGFAVEPTQGDIAPFIKLTSVVTNHDRRSIEYLLDYLAHMVQKPEQIPGVAIVFKGVAGGGKGTWVSTVGKLCPAHYTHLTDTNLLTGDFNGHFMKTLVCFADEVTWGGDKQAENKLKGMITEKERMINDKNKTAITVRNFLRLFFASNDDWVVPVMEGDRRYFVNHISPELKGKVQPGEFFDLYDKWLNNGGLEKIFGFLKRRDISKFVPQDYPHNQARLEMMLTSLPLPKKFIYSVLNGDIDLSESVVETTPDGEARWNRNALYSDLMKWSKSQGFQYVPKADEFGKAMKDAFNFEQDNENWRTNWKNKNTGYYYKIPTLKVAMERFAKNICNAEPGMLFFGYEGDTPKIDKNIHDIRPVTEEIKITKSVEVVKEAEDDIEDPFKFEVSENVIPTYFNQPKETPAKLKGFGLKRG